MSMYVTMLTEEMGKKLLRNIFKKHHMAKRVNELKKKQQPPDNTAENRESEIYKITERKEGRKVG